MDTPSHAPRHPVFVAVFVVLAVASWIMVFLLSYGFFAQVRGGDGFTYQDTIPLFTGLAAAMVVTAFLRPRRLAQAVTAFACLLAVPAHLLDATHHPLFALFMALAVLVAGVVFGASALVVPTPKGTIQGADAANPQGPAVPSWHVDRHPSDERPS